MLCLLRYIRYGPGPDIRRTTVRPVVPPCPLDASFDNLLNFLGAEGEADERLR